MKKILKKLILLIPGLFLASLLLGQPMVKVEVSSDTIGIGETVDISYTIENGAGDFTFPVMEGLQVISGPNTSSSFMYQDGKVSSTQSYSFTLQAVEAGKLVIPGTYYQTGKEKLDIQPVEIIVLSMKDKPSSPKSITQPTPST